MGEPIGTTSLFSDRHITLHHFFGWTHTSYTEKWCTLMCPPEKVIHPRRVVVQSELVCRYKLYKHSLSDSNLSDSNLL